MLTLLLLLVVEVGSASSFVLSTRLDSSAGFLEHISCTNLLDERLLLK